MKWWQATWLSIWQLEAGAQKWYVSTKMDVLVAFELLTSPLTILTTFVRWNAAGLHQWFRWGVTEAIISVNLLWYPISIIVGSDLTFTVSNPKKWSDTRSGCTTQSSDPTKTSVGDKKFHSIQSWIERIPMYTEPRPQHFTVSYLENAQFWYPILDR
jgi:hypothetical protein